MKTNEFKVGDPVIIKGVVSSIDSGIVYPIIVKMGIMGSMSFTNDGRMYEAHNLPDLFPAPEFEYGEEIEVRNDFGEWVKRIFIHQNGVRYNCVFELDKEKFESGRVFGTSVWMQARKIQVPTEEDQKIQACIKYLEEKGKLIDGKILKQ